MKATFLQTLLFSALTMSLTACDLELKDSEDNSDQKEENHQCSQELENTTACEPNIENPDESNDQPLVLSQEYNTNTSQNDFVVQGNGISVTYSTDPIDSGYNQSQIYQATDDMALFHVYNEGNKQFFYIEDDTAITLGDVSSILDSYLANQIIYAIASVNNINSFVSFSEKGIEVIASPINEQEFVKKGDAYYFSIDNELDSSSQLVSYNGTTLTTEKIFDGTNINNLNAFPDTLMYKLTSTGKIHLDNLTTSRELDLISAYPLASKNGAHIVYNHDWGTPVFKISANSNTAETFNLHTPQPEIAEAESLFWAREHFSNNYGAIYQFNGDTASAVLSEINESLLSGLSSDQVKLGDTLYLLATTQDNDRHILAVNSNDEITVTKSFTSGSIKLIEHEGVLHYSAREYIGNSYYEYNIYNLEQERVKTLYKYLETET
jgi:hypothetical protein